MSNELKRERELRDRADAAYAAGDLDAVTYNETRTEIDQRIHQLEEVEKAGPRRIGLLGGVGVVLLAMGVLSLIARGPYSFAFLALGLLALIAGVVLNQRR